MAIQSVIELLRLDPQKFHTHYYNQSTIQPENDEEPILVEADPIILFNGASDSMDAWDPTF